MLLPYYLSHTSQLSNIDFITTMSFLWVFPPRSGFLDLIVLTGVLFFVMCLGLFVFIFFLIFFPCFEHTPAASSRASHRLKELTDVFYGLNTTLHIPVWCLSFPVKTQVFTYVESVTIIICKLCAVRKYYLTCHFSSSVTENMLHQWDSSVLRIHKFIIMVNN